jgi:hypothetical protein
MKNENGGLFIEFLIFFIMVITLTMAVIEFTTLFLTKEKIAHLARESANLTFNACKKNIISTQRTEDCYNNKNIEGQILHLSSEILGSNADNLKLIFQFWGSRDENYLPIPPTFFLTKSVISNLCSPEIAGKTSKLNQQDLINFTNSGVDLASAEVFYQFQPITPLGKLLKPTGILPEVFYETTIF